MYVSLPNLSFLLSFLPFLIVCRHQLSESVCGQGMWRRGQIQRVLFCTGKIHYELYKERQRLGLTNKVAIIRIEQVQYLHRHIYDL